MSQTTALQKIEAAEKTGALVFVDREWVTEKTPLYKPEVTEIKIDSKEDCFLITGKFMPKREVVDKIGEANGVDFILGDTKSVTVEDEICGKRTVFKAVAQGRKMMSDGSWRTSSKCDYEFDPVLRAMLDYNVTELNEKTKQVQKKGKNGEAYGATLARYILELQKVAAQRANTGARLRVIRELVGMPVAFEPKDIEKPLLFGRMVQNTEYILKTPEGRAMATAKALGMDMASLFGKPSLPSAAAVPEEPENTRSVNEPEDRTEPENEKSPADLAAEAADADDDFPAEEGDAQLQGAEPNEFEKVTTALEEYLTYKDYLNINTASGTNPYELAVAELNRKDATLDSRSKMLERVRNFLIKKNVKGVA